jgi:predicted metal-dependent HD superfamily phosphohydrolase
MGKHDPDPVQQAGEQVFELFRQGSPDSLLVFRGFKRSQKVVDACREIAFASKMNGADLQAILLAAWFYDAGYAPGQGGTRQRSMELAHDFLQHAGQPESLIEAVGAAIAKAESPAPDDLPQEILHDALLLPIASKSFLQDAELYRLEHERRTGEVIPDVEWTRRCIGFLDSHQFRTRYAHVEYNRRRAANLVRLHKRLREQEEKAVRRKVDDARFSRAVGRTVEDIWSIQTREEIRLLAIMDKRTSTMIHVNAIMMSLVVAILVRKLDEHPRLIVPTLVLLTANVVTIFISVFSLRAGRAANKRLFGNDLALHDANPLVFATPRDESLTEFTQRMGALAQDADALKKSMLEQLYFGRKFIIARVKKLRLTYDVFIYGLLLSLVVFAISLSR